MMDETMSSRMMSTAGGATSPFASDSMRCDCMPASVEKANEPKTSAATIAARLSGISCSRIRFTNRAMT
jgi:hypothetical protein